MSTALSAGAPILGVLQAPIGLPGVAFWEPPRRFIAVRFLSEEIRRRHDSFDAGPHQVGDANRGLGLCRADGLPVGDGPFRPQQPFAYWRGRNRQWHPHHLPEVDRNLPRSQRPGPAAEGIGPGRPGTRFRRRAGVEPTRNPDPHSTGAQAPRYHGDRRGGTLGLPNCAAALAAAKRALPDGWRVRFREIPTVLRRSGRRSSAAAADRAILP